MAAIYLKHPIHGAKVACTDVEAAHDRLNGWEDFDPPSTPEAAVPSFLAPSLPATFPGREALLESGFTSLGSLTDKTIDELTAIKGIGLATATKILEVMDS